MKDIKLIYSQNYKIGLLGLEKLHPFDASKSNKIFRHFQFKKNVEVISSFSKVSLKNLRRVHTESYLKSIKKSKSIAKVLQMPILKWIPSALLNKFLVNSFYYQTEGTYIASKVALKSLLAINLGGGFHHAETGFSSGFSMFADIPMAIKRLQDEKPKVKVLVVDLDAHQGNGLSESLKADPNVKIFDMYNHEIFPKDHQFRKYIDYNYPLESHVKGKDYLNLLKANLLNVIEEVSPDIVFYNAGTDVFKEDPKGKMDLSINDIIERDEFVVHSLLEKKIPTVMTLSGGYTKKSAKIIIKSIENLIQKLPN